MPHEDNPDQIQQNQLAGPETAGNRRLFFAIPLPESVRRSLQDVATRLQKAAHFTPLKASWVSTENLHVTLHFLGSVPEAQAQRLIKDLPMGVAGLRSFTLDVRHLGYFPHERGPRVLWAGIHKPPIALKTTYEFLGKFITDRGIPLQHDNFHAHVTMARFKILKGTAMFVKQAETYKHLKFGDAPVNRIDLMESKLTPSGAQYDVIASGMLAGGGAENESPAG